MEQIGRQVDGLRFRTGVGVRPAFSRNVYAVLVFQPVQLRAKPPLEGRIEQDWRDGDDDNQQGRMTLRV